MSKEAADKAIKVLGLGEGLAGPVAQAWQQIPSKGSLDSAVPVEPEIYRFHEIT
jgi:cyanate lyase